MRKDFFKPDPFYNPLRAWSHWYDDDENAITCVHHNVDGYGFVEGHIKVNGNDFPQPTIYQKDLPDGVVRAPIDSDKCLGIEIEKGVFSGCNQSAGDCPTCGK